MTEADLALAARISTLESEIEGLKQALDRQTRESNLIRAALQQELSGRVPDAEKNIEWNAGYRARQVEEWSIGTYRRMYEALRQQLSKAEENAQSLRVDARALAELLLDPHRPYDTEASEAWCKRRDTLLSQPQIQKLLDEVDH